MKKEKVLLRSKSFLIVTNQRLLKNYDFKLDLRAEKDY